MHRRLIAIVVCGALAGWAAAGALTSAATRTGAKDTSRLAVSQTTARSAILGEPLTYLVTVSNRGSVPLTQVRLEQSFSQDITFRSSQPSTSCTSSERSVNCDVPDLGSGQSVRFRFAVVPRQLGTLVNQLRTTASNGAAATSAPLTWQVQPRPVLGSTANLSPVSGVAFVRTPAATRYRRLVVGRTLPVGTSVDARRGKVRVTSVKYRRGPLQVGDFFAGAFTVRQGAGPGAVTEILAVGGDFSDCRFLPAIGMARQAQVAKPRRRVWGNGRGRFRTRGRYGAATVRGTVWLTVDRCDGTLFVVRSGVISVFDFALRRTVVVRAGRSYFVRARRLA